MSALPRTLEPPAPEYREPPNNIEAEQALLGALLVNNRALDMVRDVVEPEHFILPVHSRLYRGIRQTIDGGGVASAITLKRHFDGDESLKEAGGAMYLAQLASCAIGSIGARDYAAIVADTWRRREMIEVFRDAMERAYGAGIEDAAGAIAASAQAQLDALIGVGPKGGGPLAYAEWMEQGIAEAERAYQRKDGLAGLTTGLKEWDEQLGGFAPGELHLLAARPSMGKSALAVQAAEDGAAALLPEGKVVLFFSLEMTGPMVAHRILARHAGRPYSLIRRGKIEAADFERFQAVRDKAPPLPLYMDATPRLTHQEIRSRALALHRKHPVGLVVVDHLGKMGKAADQARTREDIAIGEQTGALRDLAKVLGAPVLLLHQLNRGVEQRDNKRPMLSDLRDAGQIEQDADSVTFIYRHHYYVREAPDAPAAAAKWHADKGIAELIVAKSRQGETGTVRVRVDLAHNRFSSMEPEGPALDLEPGNLWDRG